MSWGRGAGLTLVAGGEHKGVDQLQGGSDEGHEPNRMVILDFSQLPRESRVKDNKRVLQSSRNGSSSASLLFSSLGKCFSQDCSLRRAREAAGLLDGEGEEIVIRGTAQLETDVCLTQLHQGRYPLKKVVEKLLQKN